MRKEYLFAAICAAFWPVWNWYVLRLSDGSDEPWGLLALVALTGLLYVNRREVRFSPGLISGAALIVYIGLYPELPPLARALCFVISLMGALRFRGISFHPGVGSLLFLSLPFLPTLQFFLGYPLRVFIAYATALILRSVGLSVTQSGTLLQFGETLIFVDAPCSGIRMLWMGSFLSACLLTAYRFSSVRSYQLIGWSFLFMLMGNVLRSLYLFFLEGFLPEYSSTLHAPIGMLVFAGSAAGILYSARLLHEETQKVSLKPTRGLLFSPRVVFVLVLLTALAPLRGSESLAKVNESNVNWPKEFEGEALTEVPLSARELKFAEGFPGKLKRFRAGNKELIVRYVEQATRKLHPSADCLKGVGYTLSPLAAEHSSSGGHWSCNLAVRKGERLKVCDRINDTKGNVWPDASSWYWSALWQRTSGPWWAYTVSSPEENTF